MASEVVRLEALLQVIHFDLTVRETHGHKARGRVDAQFECERTDDAELLEVLGYPSLNDTLLGSVWKSRQAISLDHVVLVGGHEDFLVG